jgi:hypothetical protein
VSLLRTEFKVERQRPPAVNAGGLLEDQDPETVTYTAHWYVEGASGDGYHEPHTPAYPVIESIVDPLGLDVASDSELMDAASNAVQGEFNLMSADPVGEPPWGEDYDIGDYGPQD